MFRRRAQRHFEPGFRPLWCEVVVMTGNAHSGRDAWPVDMSQRMLTLSFAD